MIWSGAAKSHMIRLDRVQHKFLMWLACNSNCPSDSLDYSHLLRHFRVMRISQRLTQHDLNLLHDIFSGRFDSPDVLSRFGLAVPARSTRVRPILHVPAARVDTVKNGLFCRLPRLANAFYQSNPSADICSDRFSFRKCVTAFVCEADVK